MQKLAAELFGTFFLVFAGTGAIVINEVSNGAITQVGIALTFGIRNSRSKHRLFVGMKLKCDERARVEVPSRAWRLICDVVRFEKRPRRRASAPRSRR